MSTGRPDPRRLRSAFAVCAVVLFAGACGTAASGQDSSGAAPVPAASPTRGYKGGIDPATTFTALSAAFMTTPSPVVMSDGKTHLAYELLLTDAASFAFKVDGVEMHDAATSALVPGSTGRVDITPLAGGQESEGTTDPGAGSTSVTMTPSSTWVAWVDVTLPAGTKVPATIEHVVTGGLVRPDGVVVPQQLRLGRTNPSTEAALVLSPPVPAGIWYMSEGCCADDTHHRRGLAPLNGTLLVPQRFAIDFYKLDDQHRTWIGDPSKLDSYLTYRVPILAAAGGKVVAAQDGFSNTTALPNPPKPPPIAETVGNHVIVQVSKDTYVLYAHMDPGSVAVRVGDQVKTGQQLGLIGSSGNSTTPHLHFQILSTPTFFPTDSFPFTFDRYTLLGRITDRIWDDNMGLEPTGTLPFAAANPARAQRKTLPIDRDVVQFP